MQRSEASTGAAARKEQQIQAGISLVSRSECKKELM